MAYLKDLVVNKVSFVERAANQRVFLLLKSANAVDNKLEPKKEEPLIMQKEIRTKLFEFAKSNLEKDKVIEEIKKAHTDLSDIEIEEIDETYELILSHTNQTNEKIEKDENIEKVEIDEDMEKEKQELIKMNDELQVRLKKLEEQQNRQNLTNWLQKECAYLPDSVDNVVDHIIKLERVDPELAKSYKDNLVKTSSMVQKSTLFREYGTANDYKSDVLPGTDLVSQVVKKMNEIKKSEKVVKGDDIVDLVKDLGSRDYAQYRAAHILRARQNV